MRAFITLEVRDKKGRVKDRLHEPSRSFISPFIWVLYAALSQLQPSAIPYCTDFGYNTAGPVYNFPPALKFSALPGGMDELVCYSPGGPGYAQICSPMGIHVGVGTAAAAMTDYGLQMRCSHGSLQADPAGTTEDGISSGDNGDLPVYGVNWECQWGQLYVPKPFYCTGVKLLLWRTGSPGNVTVSMRPSTGGADYVSATVNCNSISSSQASPQWVEFDWGTPLTNEPWYSGSNYGTSYYLVVRAPSGDASDCVHWRKINSTASYGRGYRFYSSNSGSNWNADGSTLYLWQILGQAAAQMEIGGCEVLDPTVSAPNVSMVIRRLFHNNCGQTVPVTEMGLYSPAYPTGQMLGTFLMMHDVFSAVNVLNGNWLLASYTFQTSV
jgi:hypothetical protein